MVSQAWPNFMEYSYDTTVDLRVVVCLSVTVTNAEMMHFFPAGRFIRGLDLILRGSHKKHFSLGSGISPCLPLTRNLPLRSKPLSPWNREYSSSRRERSWLDTGPSSESPVEGFVTEIEIPETGKFPLSVMLICSLCHVC